MGDLTTNFSRFEMVCQHCGAEGVKIELVQALQRLRDLADLPIYVTSAYRCPQHPKSLERPGSKHTRGEAADIRCPGMSARDLYTLATRIPDFHGFGVDDHKNYVHVDIRPIADTQTVAMWCYDPEGTVVPFYSA